MPRMGLMAGVLATAAAAAAAAPQTAVVIATAQGRVRGTIRTTASGAAVAEYKGIPFAQPPLGAGRFAPPRPPLNWTGERDATEFKHNCIQGAMNMGYPQPSGEQSEDCLYLNVYAPAALDPGTKPIPVIFWIFGGGFQGGGGNETRLNGTWDVALQNGKVIVVTHSYRVNVFGFLASDLLRPRDPNGGSTGNYGIQDQRAAMRWTRRNINRFGGDPDRIYIVGQSAGASSVSQHLVRPKSWGLFSSAGLESGAFYDGVSTNTPDSMRGTWHKLVSYLNCSGSADVVACVVAAPTAALSTADKTCCGGWSITVDGVDLTAPGPVLAAAGKLAPVPIVAGSVREDIASAYCAVPNPGSATHSCAPANCSATDLVLYSKSLGLDHDDTEAFVAAYSDQEGGHPANGPVGATPQYWAIKHAGADAWATCPARRIARWYHSVGQPSFWYYWTHVPDGPNGKGGAHHACEQPFVFHVLQETAEELKEDSGKYHINATNPLEVALSAQVVQFFATMAGTGRPGPDWPLYTPAPGHINPGKPNNSGNPNDETAMIFGDASPARPAVAQPSVRTAKCNFWDRQFNKVLAHYAAGTLADVPPAARTLHLGA